jgi:hypothetical protein
MNNYGQKFVDSFETPELAPFAADWRDGATILYGHTLLQRACGKGYMSKWAKAAFDGDRARANAFYLDAGRRGFPPRQARELLSGLPDDADERQVASALAGLA